MRKDSGRGVAAVLQKGCGRVSSAKKNRDNVEVVPTTTRLARNWRSEISFRELFPNNPIPPVRRRNNSLKNR